LPAIDLSLRRAGPDRKVAVALPGLRPWQEESLRVLGAPKRIMRNEGALIAELRRRGFDIVVPGTLPFTEQVRTFRNASLVVGPHGAGLTNIAFCEPGTIV